MENVPEIAKYLAGGGGTLGLVFLLAKAGLLKLQIGASSNGHLNGKQDQINQDLFEHVKVANHEMAEIKTDIAVINTRLGAIERDMAEMRQDIKTLLQR